MDPTKAVFAQLKPLCVAVMGLLTGQGGTAAPMASGGSLSGSPSRVWDTQPLQQLLAAIPTLDPTGLPRCIDYVLIPLTMLLPDLTATARAKAERLSQQQQLPTAPDSIQELAYRCIAALFDAVDAPLFCSDSDRVSSVVGRAIVTLTDFADAASVSHVSSGRSGPSDETASAACSVLARICGYAGGIQLSTPASNSERGSAGDASLDGSTEASGDCALSVCPFRGLSVCPPPLSSKAVAGHTIAVLLSLACGDNSVGISVSSSKSRHGREHQQLQQQSFSPQGLTSISPGNTLVTRTAGSNSRLGRELRLSALSALAAVVGAIGRHPYQPQLTTPQGHVDENDGMDISLPASSSTPPSDGSDGPSPSQLRPFLPGLVSRLTSLALSGIGLTTAAAAAAALGATGTDDSPGIRHDRPGARVAAVAVDVLALTLDLAVVQPCGGGGAIATGTTSSSNQQQWWTATSTQLAAVLAPLLTGFSTYLAVPFKTYDKGERAHSPGSSNVDGYSGAGPLHPTFSRLLSVCGGHSLIAIGSGSPSACACCPAHSDALLPLRQACGDTALLIGLSSNQSFTSSLSYGAGGIRLNRLTALVCGLPAALNDRRGSSDAVAAIDISASLSPALYLTLLLRTLLCGLDDTSSNRSAVLEAVLSGYSPSMVKATPFTASAADGGIEALAGWLLDCCSSPAMDGGSDSSPFRFAGSASSRDQAEAVRLFSHFLTAFLGQRLLQPSEASQLVLVLVKKAALRVGAPLANEASVAGTTPSASEVTTVADSALGFLKQAGVQVEGEAIGFDDTEITVNRPLSGSNSWFSLFAPPPSAAAALWLASRLTEGLGQGLI